MAADGPRSSDSIAVLIMDATGGGKVDVNSAKRADA